MFTAAAIRAAAQSIYWSVEQRLELRRDQTAAVRLDDDAAAPEDGLGEPCLDPIAQPREKHQKKTDADQNQRLYKGRLRDAFYQDQLKRREDH